MPNPQTYEQHIAISINSGHTPEYAKRPQGKPESDSRTDQHNAEHIKRNPSKSNEVLILSSSGLFSFEMRRHLLAKLHVTPQYANGVHARYTQCDSFVDLMGNVEGHPDAATAGCEHCKHTAKHGQTVQTIQKRVRTHVHMLLINPRTYSCWKETPPYGRLNSYRWKPMLCSPKQHCDSECMDPSKLKRCVVQLGEVQVRQRLGHQSMKFARRHSPTAVANSLQTVASRGITTRLYNLQQLKSALLRTVAEAAF
jgi:hypothetical protein